MIYKFEKFIVSLIVVLSILCIGLNILDKNEIISTVSSTSNEQTKLVNSSNYLQAGVIKMSFSESDGVKILVNGEEDFNYTLKNNIMTLAVSDKDVVEVDLRNFKEDKLSVLVLKVSDNIKSPMVNEKYEFNKGINKLFSVKI
ncbi:MULTISPECIES: hypothetical protein [unclassified Anaerofustis]|uniref:hypothetical protein n=1 Tax=Anaerofustis TaxID=264995 RepID=UPI00209BE938|nr:MULTISPECIES: hypothetical protein [unclassified Anaerofustis]MCO8192957.1 hypothetical protein [Anaerofustis sp. NSJ-163]